MEHSGFLFQAFIYLLAAVISVPVAKRIGLGSILGYLIAGVIIGPFVLSLVGDEEGVMHIAEFGVVLMLFLIGLELRPALLWRMRSPILGMGGLQVLITSIFIALIGLAFGLTWNTALIIGMILALSSTAIVLQTLNEKGWMKTGAGESCFSVLLFQDIAVIPLLAVMPLLAVGVNTDQVVSDVQSLDPQGLMKTFKVVGAVLGIVFAGKYLIRHIFRIIADTKLRELFTAMCLLLVVGIAVLMELVGLSPALGTFLAGVMLADSEYRHELESNIEPFKGLLLGLFFISVGASIDFQILIQNPFLIFSLVLLLITVKFLVLFALSKFYKMTLNSGFLFSFALAQGGEFAFVLFSFASQNSLIDTNIVNLLMVVVALSMAITPLLIIFFEHYFEAEKAKLVDAPSDEMENEENPILIAGYGRFGQIAGRLLASNGFKLTILDNNASHIEVLRGFGNKVYYGDACRHDLLTLAGANFAKLLIIAIEGREKINELVKTAMKYFPHLHIMVRADNRAHAFELLKLGVPREDIYRVTFGTSLELGRDALKHLGFNGYRAQRAALMFKKHDNEVLFDLHEQYFKDYKGFQVNAISRDLELTELFSSDIKDAQEHPDEAWTSK